MIICDTRHTNCQIHPPLCEPLEPNEHVCSTVTLPITITLLIISDAHVNSKYNNNEQWWCLCKSNYNNKNKLCLCNPIIAIYNNNFQGCFSNIPSVTDLVSLSSQLNYSQGNGSAIYVVHSNQHMLGNFAFYCNFAYIKTLMHYMHWSVSV